MTQIEINTATLVLAIATALIGIWQYGSTKRSEFRKRFWEEQLQIYKRTCAAAATIATAEAIAKVEQERRAFWQLYWGELSILESKAVKTAMERFGNQLLIVEAGKADPRTLEDLSYELARACRMSLKKTWEPVRVDDLPESTAQAASSD
jgi:hypothetical protein